MSILYKITDSNNVSRPGHQNALKWELGKRYKASGVECYSSSVLHAYESPELAELLNPAHGNYESGMKFWKADGKICMKAPDCVGCTELEILEEIPRPSISQKQKLMFSVLCSQSAMRSYDYDHWHKWSELVLKENFSDVDFVVSLREEMANAAFKSLSDKEDNALASAAMACLCVEHYIEGKSIDKMAARIAERSARSSFPLGPYVDSKAERTYVNYVDLVNRAMKY